MVDFFHTNCSRKDVRTRLVFPRLLAYVNVSYNNDNINILIEVKANPGTYHKEQFHRLTRNCIIHNKALSWYTRRYFCRQKSLLSPSLHRVELRTACITLQIITFVYMCFRVFSWVFEPAVWFILFFPEAPPAAQERRTQFYCLIGVFWLCAGNDRLDVVHLSGVYSMFRYVLCRGARIYPLDDHGGIILARSQTRRHVHRGPRQLDG